MPNNPRAYSWCLTVLGRKHAVLWLAARSKLVPATGCREWSLATDKYGYGTTWFLDKLHKAHRLACETAHGPAPEGLPNALHTCDNPPCVEGSHLYWGTQKHNVRDMLERDRSTQRIRVGGVCGKNIHNLTSEADIYTYPSGRQKCRKCMNKRGAD
jgi:hypothetical protein